MEVSARTVTRLLMFASSRLTLRQVWRPRENSLTAPKARESPPIVGHFVGDAGTIRSEHEGHHNLDTDNAQTVGSLPPREGMVLKNSKGELITGYQDLPIIRWP